MTAMSWPRVGTRFGKRVVTDVGLIRIDPSGRERPCIMLLCSCGNTDLVPVSAAKKTQTCPRCADKGRSWTLDERRAHAARIKEGIAKASARRSAADRKAVNAAKTRRRRKILASEAG